MKVKAGTGVWTYRMKYPTVQSNEKKTSSKCVHKGLVELSTIKRGSTPLCCSPYRVLQMRILLFCSFAYNFFIHPRDTCHLSHAPPKWYSCMHRHSFLRTLLHLRPLSLAPYHRHTRARKPLLNVYTMSLSPEPIVFLLERRTDRNGWLCHPGLDPASPRRKGNEVSPMEQCRYCQQPLADTEKVRWYDEHIHTQCYDAILTEAIAIIVTE